MIIEDGSLEKKPSMRLSQELELPPISLASYLSERAGVPEGHETRNLHALELLHAPVVSEGRRAGRRCPHGERNPSMRLSQEAQLLGAVLELLFGCDADMAQPRAGGIMAAMDEFNRHPVVHTWSYKLDQAA